MATKHIDKLKLSPQLAGIAGEYFVAGELSARGHIASITLRNSKGVDIICTNESTTSVVAIQVKTSKGSVRTWVLNDKCEENGAENFYYIFVNLNYNQKPVEYFIVPSQIVSQQVKNDHSAWLNTLGRKGQTHNNTSMRKFSDLEEKHLNRWDLLGL